jgi:hypothetical protein
MRLNRSKFQGRPLYGCNWILACKSTSERDKESIYEGYYIIKCCIEAVLDLLTSYNSSVPRGAEIYVMGNKIDETPESQPSEASTMKLIFLLNECVEITLYLSISDR